MTLYTLRTAGPSFTITKFDSDLNVVADKDGRLSVYTLTLTDDGLACDCPAGHRDTCRHRQMYPMLRNRVDTAWFYDFDTGRWSDPTGEAGPTVIESNPHKADSWVEQRFTPPKSWRRF